MQYTNLNFISVVDSNFFQGFWVMIYSLYKHNPELKKSKYIILDGGLSNAEISKIKTLIPNLEVKKQKSLLIKESKHLKRLEKAYLKFYAYSNNFCDTLIILDCDLLILKPLNILDFSNIPKNTISACQCCIENRGYTQELNSGVVVVPRGIDKFSELINSVNIKNSHLADQGVINLVFKGYNKLPKKYNVEKRIIPKFFKIEDVSILHYVGDVKPWHDASLREEKYLTSYLLWDIYKKESNYGK